MENKNTKTRTPEPPQVKDPTSKKEREKKKAPQSGEKDASKKPGKS